MADSGIGTELVDPSSRLALGALRVGLDLCIERGRAALGAQERDAWLDAAFDEADALLDAMIELLPATPPVRL